MLACSTYQETFIEASKWLLVPENLAGHKQKIWSSIQHFQSLDVILKKIFFRRRVPDFCVIKLGI
jgi:hypothetical protein